MKLIGLAGRGWSDERGWTFRPLDEVGIEPARFMDVHIASVVAGAVRGNHVHPNVTEWLPVFGAPGVAHAVRCDGPGTAFPVSWADGAAATDPVAPLL